MNSENLGFNPFQNPQNSYDTSFSNLDPVYQPQNGFQVANSNIQQTFNSNSNTQTSDFKPFWNEPINNCTVAAPVMEQAPFQEVAPTPSEQVYTKYNDLPNFGSNIDVIALIKQLQLFFQDKTNWKNTFDAIDNLRILNKYYTQELNAIVINFWKSIVECLENRKTFIAKNALIFVTEVFMNSKNVRLHDDIITGIVPLVLVKASSEKGVLKKEAQEALRELTTNCCFDSTIIILSKESQGKNASIADIAILTLAHTLNNIGQNISKLNNDTLVFLTKTLAATLDTGKLANMKKLAGMICMFICQLFGLEGYGNLIQNCNLSQSEIAAMVKVVDSKKDNGTRSSAAFQTFVHEKKKQVRQSQVGLMNSTGNLNKMPNPGGPFTGLNYVSKDQKVVNGIFSSQVNNENSFMNANTGYNGMNNMNNNGWNQPGFVSNGFGMNNFGNGGF